MRLATLCADGDVDTDELVGLDIAGAIRECAHDRRTLTRVESGPAIRTDEFYTALPRIYSASNPGSDAFRPQ